MIVKKIEKGTFPKLVDGTLPDIDTDFCGKDRTKIKTYIENRFGYEQVCSVGTLTTMKLKGLVKDFARFHSIDFSEANLITSIIDFKDNSMLDLFKRAAQEPRLKAFIQNNSDIFYTISQLIEQPKTLSIHPCAMIIFPDVMEAGQWCPIRNQDGLIVSEWGGTEMDDAGFLKEDILGIKQLDKFDAILKLIEQNGKEVPDIFNLPHDTEVYRYFSNGWNGDVFQMGSSGLTEYSKSLKPENINDLIAAVALYRPGPMENHYHEIYVKCKNQGRPVNAIKGTEKITKDTYGILIYQEQIMSVFTDIAGLSMKEADDVRRALGKKKLSVLLPWKTRVWTGFEEKGFSESEFEEIWGAIEEFAKYSFNKSHSAAYALTSYVCQYLKVHYPIEYWTVSLQFAGEDETLTYLSEIMQAKAITIRPPDINQSHTSMIPNQESSTIFWGIESIKGIGEDTANQIIEEREKNGEYKSFADFYFRHAFVGSKVKKQTYEALIGAGAFDALYGFVGREQFRMNLISRYRKFKKVKVSNPKTDLYTIGNLGERYWWLLNQKHLTGLAFIDYKELAEDMGIETPFCTALESTVPQENSITRAFGGYVVEVRISKSKRGDFARLTIEHNYKLFKMIVWSEEFKENKEAIKNSEKKLILFDADLKYEAKYSRANQFTITKKSHIYVL